AGRSIDLSLSAMMRCLSMIVFVPILIVEILQRVTPKLIGTLRERQFPVTVGFLALVNLAVFSKYARFFRQQPDAILIAALVAVVLAALFMLFGLLIFWKSPVPDQLATAICMCNINNVLVLVFSSEFFGPLEPTLAAMYLFPFYSVIIPMGMYRRWRMG
ncbi:MAG: bile acid:sodium symporter, partial [Deltaproteobacteria bacterium]|nr:bile acid:sodium symporter [Deltaproteobacteria bacterium]